MPTEASFPFWTDEKLRIQDTDLNGHVNNAAIASLCEAGRGEIIFAVAGDARTRPLAAALRRVTIDYLSEVHYPGRVRIGSAIARVGNTSITIRQELFLGERRFAAAESVIVFMDRVTRRPAPLLDAWREAAERFAPVEA
ncbi:acyl-CoA thioesterase [Roseococcus pinisoli]|uniref:Acyl-CoA thioesterase n=1 Tax=Roseococcus pinisoli TaxID=2835040 RepID=A0ABS5Q871_9PROT|nr:thioesterase family protein [uncultured Roseococcus sp.]MBS7809877.1 acyl-CoA thioesterase [Roseococcus pinisoli]